MLPTEIPLMGQIVKIQYQYKLDLDGEELSGACMPAANLIMVSTSEHETERDIIKTIAHEAVHCVLGKSGLADLLGEHEESVVVAIEENFFPLCNFNRRKWRKKVEVEIGRKN